jgi:hypothetical protein
MESVHEDVALLEAVTQRLSDVFGNNVSVVHTGGGLFNLQICFRHVCLLFSPDADVVWTYGITDLRGEYIRGNNTDVPYDCTDIPTILKAIGKVLCSELS